MTRTRSTLFFSMLGAVACSPLDEGSDDGHGEETEVITTVTLTFTPQGGAPIVASFRDPDGNGGMSGTTDPIALAAATTYTMSVAFLDELQSPAASITDEIEAEAEEHQIFVYGSAVTGPAMADTAAAIVQHAYTDRESDYGADAGDDLPVGLQNTMTTRAAGTGEIAILLRHLPELNATPQKVPDLAADLAAGEPLPGEVDAMVTFMLTVQ